MGIMKTLTINGVKYDVIPSVPTSSVTLLASAWVGDGDAYSQVVEIPRVTSQTKVDLQPTSEQLAEFHYKVLAFVAENTGGVVTVYAIGDKPANDHTIQITLTEVEGKGKIRGNTVGTTMPRPDWAQTDPKKADFIKNKPVFPERPVKNGDGSNSTVYGTGDANGDYSIAGGTNDKSLIKEIIGNDLAAALVSVDNPTANGDLSVSFGAGTKTHAAGAMAFGVNSQAGCKGFYWTAIDFNAKKITLSTTQGSQTKPSSIPWSKRVTVLGATVSKGDIVSITNDGRYVNCAEILDIDTSAGTITVDVLPFTKVNKPTTTYPNDYAIFVVEKPDKGEVEFGWGAYAHGYDNVSAGVLAFTSGTGNRAAADFGAVFGKGNTGGYAALVGGTDNQVLGETSSATGAGNTNKGNKAHTEGANNTNRGNMSHVEGLQNTNSGGASHVEGYKNSNTGSDSHVEGDNNTNKGTCSHVEGNGNVNEAEKSHVEGDNNTNTGKYGHVEGKENTNSGDAAHAEGKKTIASGEISHAEGYDTRATGTATHAEGDRTTASGAGAHAEGVASKAIGDGSHAEGANINNSGSTLAAWILEDGTVITGNVARGASSHAEGAQTYASGWAAHAEGRKTIASYTGAHAEGVITTSSGYGSHAEGNYSNATGEASHAEGFCTDASGARAHAEGQCCVARGNYSHAEGENASAFGTGSHAEGYQTRAYGQDQHVQGRLNIKDTDGNYAHIVGGGTRANWTYRNIHTLDWSGNASFAGVIASQGADYAEFFEWQDGNPANEDRVGLAVSLDGDKIKLAESGDDVLGIISGTAAILGDNAEWEWKQKYLVDDFGRIRYEEVEQFVDVREVDHETGEITVVKKSLGMASCPMINPDYDDTKTYVSRAKRPEWGVVGMFGKLYVRDDGTCVVNGHACVGDSGVVTASDARTNLRVLKRVTENIVQVLLK